MMNPCKVLLENEAYIPGQIINGIVECNFAAEDKVRAIRVRFKGRAKVYWQDGRHTHYNANELYFEMVTDLVSCETTFQPGTYSYPFTFNLPVHIPPSLKQAHGDIKYFVEAVVDRPWAIDYKEKRAFTVNSFIDLNTIDHLKSPVDIDQIKRPFSFFSNSGSISFRVHLPTTGYAPTQVVTFTTKVKNNSEIDIQGIQFRLLQGFTFRAQSRSKVLKTFKGQKFKIVDAVISPGRERSWDLELRLPSTIFTEDLRHCNIIKSFAELRGEVILPLPHRNLKLRVPLTFGILPLYSNLK